MKLHLRWMVAFILFIAMEAMGAGAIDRPNATWDRYLDYAYIYSSASMPDLAARLDRYAVEAGISLQDYAVELQSLDQSNAAPNSLRTRRLAIAYLLEYLARGEAPMLERSVDAIDALVAEHDRYEDRYWFRYIHAHRALERADSRKFVDEVFGLWFEGVAPIESSYETVHTVSLADSAQTGFVAALPYLYENVGRLILIRSRAMGVETGLDSLAALVRLLNDDRIGAYPRVVPVEASSKAFLDRIMARLDGPGSDGGRLTFTLALFDAVKYHDIARSSLASEGFSEKTIEAIAIASGAYENALGQARTPLGKSTVYRQALRQIGEVHAAKQRLGVDPDLYMPLRIRDALSIYDKLYAARDGRRWLSLGFRNTAANAYEETLHGLWEEIQEAGMNQADYHLSRAQIDVAHADEHLRSAESIYVRYLSMDRKYGHGEGSELVPDSATFGVYEAAKGFGDIHLLFSANAPSPSVAAAVTDHYLIGLKACPFDRELWASLAKSLEQQDQSGEFLGYAQPIVDVIESSRRLQEWIAMSREGDASMAALRLAVSDDRALLMMGFAANDGGAELASELTGLRDQRSELSVLLVDLQKQLAELDQDEIGKTRERIATNTNEELPSVSGGPPPTQGRDRESLLSEAGRTETQIQELDSRIEGFANALPLYLATINGGELIQSLRAQRDHPAHGLLRRLRREMN